MSTTKKKWPATLAGKVRRLAELRAEAAKLDADIKDLQALTMESMNAEGHKSYKVNTESGYVQATVVTSTPPIIIDEVALKKALGPKIWPKVTVQVLDQKMLETRIAEGMVDPMTVAECSVEGDARKPYLKVTSKSQSL